jgi:hypothetical protein
VTSQPRAFFAVDLGSATSSAAVLGHVGGRWRLIAHTAAPASVDLDSMLIGLLTQIGRTDAEMFEQLCAGDAPDIPTLVATWPRVVARSTPQRRIAVLAGSRRQRRRLESAALRAGWLVVGGSADDDDPVALSRLVLSIETSAVLLGADHSPAGDEKRHLPDLAALVAAAAQSRPELTVVLAGGAAAYESAFAALADARSRRQPMASSAGESGAAYESESVAAESFEKAQSKKEWLPSEGENGTDTAPGDAEPNEETAAQPHNARGPAADLLSAEQSPDKQPDGEDAWDEVLVSVEPGAAEQAGSTADEAATADQAATADEAAAVGPGDAATATVKAAAPLPFVAAETVAAIPHVLLAPDAEAGQPSGASLQQVLEGLRASPNDSRLGVARSIASLAYVLDRSIETIEIGLQGGLWSRSEPFGQGHFTVVTSHACLADASFAPANPSEEVIDSVMAWSTAVLDRHKAMDRLNDLRLTPWGEADGDGAVFRITAAKAAFARLIAAEPEMAANPMPELLIAAGGVFATSPPSVVALAMADLVRRHGVCHLAADEARLLGPLGVIEDESERRRLMANLADDILMPLGSLILPAGVRQGRSAGHLRLKGAASVQEIELHPGVVQVVDLPPGRAARADIEFRDAVRLGNRARHFSVDVGGGLGGLLIDLRDIPMRISDRPESRRQALDAWQRGMWPEVDE